MVSTHPKNISQNGNLPQIGVKINIFETTNQKCTRKKKRPATSALCTSGTADSTPEMWMDPIDNCQVAHADRMSQPLNPQVILILLMEQIRLTSWYGKYPIIYRVSYMSGACFGFLPSTVVIHVILSGFPRKSPKQLPSKSLFSILRPGKGITLQEINISHLGKRKIIFKIPFLGDMLVPRRVCLSEPLIFVWGSSDDGRDRSTESLSTNN